MYHRSPLDFYKGSFHVLQSIIVSKQEQRQRLTHPSDRPIRTRSKRNSPSLRYSSPPKRTASNTGSNSRARPRRWAISEIAGGGNYFRRMSSSTPRLSVRVVVGGRG